ncbi:hypothetical protein GGQ84_002268 [Desulfitispora alkaliphila]|uniref:ribosomal-processing cysteine protease Prp n=1 Tax=Desulfitispora alkaliphila TaxID=622674 RepID=UPI003D1D69A0
MTIVELFRDENKKIIAFKVTGHTGFAQRGKDIVCSAVSVLTQTAVIGLSAYLKQDPQVELKDGFLHCTLPDNLSEQEAERAQVILNTMAMGLEATAEEYRDYLEIVKRRWS